MSQNAIMIDYHFCTGCKSCEMACQVEKGLPIGKCGIVVQEVGPWEVEGDWWQDDFVPHLTELCDLCAERTERGELPTCVKHCMAAVMTFGPLDELAKAAEGKHRQVIYVR